MALSLYLAQTSLVPFIAPPGARGYSEESRSTIYLSALKGDLMPYSRSN